MDYRENRTLNRTLFPRRPVEVITCNSHRIHLQCQDHLNNFRCQLLPVNIRIGLTNIMWTCCCIVTYNMLIWLIYDELVFFNPVPLDASNYYLLVKRMYVVFIYYCIFVTQWLLCVLGKLWAFSDFAFQTRKFFKHDTSMSNTEKYVRPSCLFRFQTTFCI